MPDYEPGVVLVRVSSEILELLKTGEAAPVVLLGVRECEDGTHEMILRTPPADA